MPNKAATRQQLLAENEGLRLRLAQVEATLREMRSGEVDALVVSEVGGAQVFTLKDVGQSFRILVEEMSEGALTMTAEGVIVYANRRFAGMLKTPLEKVIGSTVRTWLAPDSQPILQSLLEKGAGEERREELSLAASDGTRLPVYLSVSNLAINGSPDAYCLVAIDLTEHNRIEAIAASERVARELLAAANHSRQELLRVIEEKTRAEKKLAQESQRNRLLLRRASDGVHILDADGNLLEVSDAFCQMLGYSREELIGANASLWDAQWSPQELKQKIAEQLGNESRSVFETRHRRKDGSLLDVEISGQGLELDGKPVLFNSARDISVRKQAQHSLQESESKYKRLIENSPDIVYVFSTKRGGIYFSPKVNSVLGYSVEHLYANPFLWSESIHAEDRAAVTKAIEELKTGSPFDIEYRIKNAEGDWRWFHDRSISSREENGDLIIEGLAMDITERKRAEVRTCSLLELSESGQDLDEKTLLQQGLDVIQKLTDSRIGFLHFVREDQKELELVTWSTDTLAHYCQATFDRHYPVSAAGIWADSVRLKQPIVINDYAIAPDRKGLPDGHSVLQRFISVPVLEDQRVRMIVGVGNANSDYAGRDVQTVKLFAYDLYRIAQRKRAQESLRESEAEFRILAESMPQIVWITGADGWNIYFNQQWMDYTGLTLEESLGHGWNKPFHPDDRKRAWDAWQRATQTVGTYSIEARLRRADGVYRWWLVRGTPVKDATGAVLKWFGTCTDIHELKMAELEIARYVEQLQIAVMSTVHVATTLSEMRDPYTAGHERRVAEIAVAIGAELGFDARRQEGLRVAGHLHDVGKITIPSEILAKPGKISAVEYQLIQAHAQAGYDVLKDVEFPWPVAQVALQHHERMDGSGYPQGLKAEAILFEARIIAVADVVEAISSHRPYRPALGIDAALTEIKRGRETAYDPVVADACLKLFREKGYVIPA